MLKIKLIVVVLLISFLISGTYLTRIKKDKDVSIHQAEYAGAVLPHHLLAKNFIDDFLSKINYIPKKIYIIGPNHFEVGDSAIITNSNSESKDLVNLGYININNQVISHEHSITVFQDILSAKYPNSQIIPIVVSSKISSKDIDSLANYLSQKYTDDTLLICSTDFSHYRLFQEAQEFDNQTINLISQKKYSQIIKLNNNYIDSPKSLLVLLKTLDKIGKNKLNILNHSNSAILLNDFSIPSTTSYFELGFN